MIDKSVEKYRARCGQNLAMDAALANLTCALRRAGLSENTVLVISTDNGGPRQLLGASERPHPARSTAVRR